MIALRPDRPDDDKTRDRVRLGPEVYGGDDEGCARKQQGRRMRFDYNLADVLWLALCLSIIAVVICAALGWL